MNSTLKVNGIHTIKSDEFLPPMQRWITIGGTLLVGAVSIAVITSALVKYKVAVKANVTIRPTGELNLVQAALEGTIKQIAVRENQSVKRGDPIAYLDDAKLQIQQSQLQGSIQQSQLQLAQVDAQIRSIDSQILAESQSSARQIAAAEIEIQRHQREYSERQRTTQADVEEAQVAVALAQDEVDRYRPLAEAGAVAEIQFKQKELALETATAKLNRAQAALNPSSAAVSVAQEQVPQQRARGQATISSLKKEQEALVQRQSEIQNQLIRDQKELEQVKRDLQRSVIRATSDGLIFQLKLQNANQVVRPGDTLTQIMPHQAPLVAKATIANQDIDKVVVGQPVQMRVSACSYPDYGILRGKVTSIAADTNAARTSGETTANTNSGNSDRTYEVVIQPEQKILINGVRQCRIQAGMNASASIISKEESFLQFLLRRARLSSNL